MFDFQWFAQRKGFLFWFIYTDREQESDIDPLRYAWLDGWREKNRRKLEIYFHMVDRLIKVKTNRWLLYNVSCFK